MQSGCIISTLVFISYAADAFGFAGVDLALSTRGIKATYRSVICQRTSIVMKASPDDARTRREFIVAGASVLLGASGFATGVKSIQAAAIEQEVVAVIGASGYTGGDCVRSLVSRGLPVRAISRTPIPLENLPTKLVSAVSADVTIPSTLPSALTGVSSVIFSASARKRFTSTGSDSADVQTYEDVEHLGLINVAKTCIDRNVKRLVVVSSSCVACKSTGAPESTVKVDKATGLSCSQCRSKRAGEDAVRELYAQANNPKVGYTIVRVGFLTTGEKRGVSQLELNQGESKTGIISRQDLADLLIAAASSPDSRGTTFECYYRDTAQPVDIAKSLVECRQLGKSTQASCPFPSTRARTHPPCRSFFCVHLVVVHAGTVGSRRSLGDRLDIRGESEQRTVGG
jgi:nucleoside-diphosphate-sugar epimerase